MERQRSDRCKRMMASAAALEKAQPHLADALALLGDVEGQWPLKKILADAGSLVQTAHLRLVAMAAGELAEG